jgi:hypothetical protein
MNPELVAFFRSAMTKRPDDKTPAPPGGRAAERLKMFENARRPNASDPKKTPDTDGKTNPQGKGRKLDEKQD